MVVAPVWMVVLLLLVVFILRRTVYLVSKIRSTPGVPRYFCIIEPLSPWGNAFKASAWNPTVQHLWTWRDRYEKRNSEIIQFVPLLLGDVALYCKSPEALKQILSDAFKYAKPQKALSLDMMGPNLIATNGEQWRKHRKITAPAFDNQIYKDVWRVTTGLYKQMLNSEAWKSGDQHYYRSFNVFTTRVALLVITACGFNMHIDWEGSLSREDLVDSVDSTIVTVASTMLERIFIPSWAYKLPLKGLRKIDRAFTELQSFLAAEVSSKRAELIEVNMLNMLDVSNKNLFTRIVMSSLQDGNKGLDDEDIIGNLFIYLFAGHETTAAALSTTLALLAINQQEQDRIHDYIMNAVGMHDLDYEDYNELAPVLHCFYEALRLYPPAPLLLRVCTEDSSLAAPRLIPDDDTLFLPRESEIYLDFIEAGRNVRVFDKASAFFPLRWATADAAADDLLSFSSGPRGCLGRKFSTVEAVCFLTHLLRDWKFDIKLENKETPSEWQERVMQPRIGISMKIDNIPLLVTRRRPSGML